MAIHLIFAFLANLHATELYTICTNPNNCKITTPQSEVTNHGTFTSSSLITIEAPVTRFINYGTITNGIYTNYDYAIGTITNYGEMHGVWAWNKQNITIDNRGIIKTAVGNYMSNQSNIPAHFMFENGESTLTIENYMIKIIETQNEFNNFSGYNSRTNNKNSHLIVWEHGNTKKFVAFKDDNSKIILDFGGDFELGKEYLISKLITSQSGTKLENLTIDFSRLTTSTSLYKLTQSGEHFIASIDAPNSEIGILNKANVRTMNNFYIISNSMIYPRKAQNLGKKNYRKVADSANYLESYESFSYRNEAQNRRIQRQNKRNYNRKSQNLNADSANRTRESQNLNADSANRTRESQNLAQNPHDYYFILTPFVNHNYFFESGRYNLNGFDYGFLTAFSAKVAESNSLGAHFMMSYGSLGDSKDKDFMIKTLNLNLGINYKLDLIWDMYLKARGDFFYFLNQAKTLTLFEAIKPNNLGFGASVAYGKDFDFKSGGMLGIEVGLDYKALQSSTISLHDNIYQKSLYHLLYADLGVSYNKYFGNFGLNAGLGIKGNITANKLAKSQIHISALDRNVDMVLDNDNFLGYANLGASYLLNHKNFDMEFSLAYYGNFGDRAISNAGGFEWRVFW